MPKNLKGGSKHKKFKNTNVQEITQKDLILKTDKLQDYGKVEKLYGNCRVELLCNDKQKRLGIIRGSMRKKQWLNINSIVLYSLREYEKDKVDIIHVYKDSVLKQLEHKMNLNFSINNEEKQLDDIFMYNSDNDIKEENNILINNENDNLEESDDIFMTNMNKQKKDKEIQEDLDNEIDELFITNKEKKQKIDLENLINEL